MKKSCIDLCEEYFSSFESENPLFKSVLVFLKSCISRIRVHNQQTRYCGGFKLSSGTLIALSCGQLLDRCTEYRRNVYMNYFVLLLFLGCLTFQQLMKQVTGTDLLGCTCCHTEIEVAGQTCFLTLSEYCDTRLTSPSINSINNNAR